MEYTVLGFFIEQPTESQTSLAKRTNDWKKKDLYDSETGEYCKTVLWNNCASPPFAGNKSDMTKYRLIEWL